MEKVYVVTHSYDWGEEYGSGKSVVKVFRSETEANAFVREREKDEWRLYDYDVEEVELV